jgi:acyl-CoA synthetase (NDP forming)
MLHPLFKPRSVAVIGASKGITSTGSVKIGTAALKYLVDHGYSGRIYPINPKETELMGLKCYGSIKEVPDQIDLACLVIPSKICIDVMKECAEKQVKTAVVFSSGFAEAGNDKLQDELMKTARQHDIRFVGPNTAGIVNVRDKIVASISMACEMNPFRNGDVAFITQSGALGGSMLGRGMDDGVGFSHWVSTGNEADLDAADFINYMVEEESVNVITLFLEGIRDGEKFLKVCQKAAKARKPIIVYKTGLSKVSAAAAKSHTGALAGSNEIFDKVCKQFGLIRVDDVAELFKTALVFSWLRGKLPKGYRVGIISASGGICGVGADECHLAGLEIPELNEACKEQLRQFIPSFGVVRNPIDCTGQIRASKTGYQDTIKYVLKQDYIDGILLLVTMAAEPRASFYGQEISKIGKTSHKPIIVAWTGALSLASRGYPMLRENRIPHFLSVREAVKAMKALADYQFFLDRFEAKAKLRAA